MIEITFHEAVELEFKWGLHQARVCLFYGESKT